MLNKITEHFVLTHLSGSECVGDALHRVDDGAGEVVGGVGLVLGASSVVGSVVEAVHHGIAHGSVHAGHVDLRTETELGERGISCEELLEELQKHNT